MRRGIRDPKAFDEASTEMDPLLLKAEVEFEVEVEVDHKQV